MKGLPESVQNTMTPRSFVSEFLILKIPKIVLDVFELLWYCVCCQKAEQQVNPLQKGGHNEYNGNYNHSKATTR